MDFINIAKAQGVDEIISPTIPFEYASDPTVFPTGSVTPTAANISLAADVSALKPGDKTTVRVSVHTNGDAIKEFTFTISYDPTLFQITDADTVNTGDQINYKDTFFLPTTNSILPQSGTIKVVAATSQGAAPITNRVVADFEITALKEGLGEIKTIKAQSSLINENQVDILQNTNSVTFTVSLTTSGTISTTPSVTPKTLGPKVLTPKTGILDDLGGFQAIFTGVLIISLGFYLWRYRKHAASHR